MLSLRKRKSTICNAILLRNAAISAEDLQWDRMPPVGREFGSPDFDRLMEEDLQKLKDDMQKQLEVQRRDFEAKIEKLDPLKRPKAKPKLSPASSRNTFPSTHSSSRPRSTMPASSPSCV